MAYHIIMDSVGDRPDELCKMDNFSVIPLRLTIDEEELVDDNSLNQKEVLRKIASSRECPKSSCPSPEAYLKIFEEHKDDRIYVITASSELTGSFNSARMAKEFFLGENPESQIHIFNSRSASAAEALIAYRLIELEDCGMEFEDIEKEMESFIENQKTLFVLEDISFLQKNGRLTGVKALLATMLNIVLILTVDSEGVIRHTHKARGIKKALKKFTNDVIEGLEEGKKGRIVISNCNCIERAEKLMEELKAVHGDLDVKIINTGGIATLYAGDGGIVVSY